MATTVSPSMPSYSPYWSAPPPSFSKAKEMEHSPPASPKEVGPRTLDSFDSAPLQSGSTVSAAEQAVCDMGIPANLVQMAKAFQLLEHGKDFASAIDLFNASEKLWNCEAEQAEIAKKLSEAKEAQKDNKTHGNDLLAHKTQDSDACCIGSSAVAEPERVIEPTASLPDTTALKERVRRLAQENHKLYQRKMCRACMVVDLASSGVTFLPCGHFVMCEACSEKYDDCPACGKSIMGTVRTFLS